MTPHRRLILVRHAQPEVRAGVPAEDWNLSEEGVRRSRELGARLDPGSALAIHSSIEPKAVDTAHALGGVWGVPVEHASGLHEHERRNEPMHPPEELEARMRRLFADPDALVFGTETGAQARRRFGAAVMRLVASRSNDIVIVTHGTVLTMFVAEATGIEPFAFWKRLEMPCAVALTLPELKLDVSSVIYVP